MTRHSTPCTQRGTTRQPEAVVRTPIVAALLAAFTAMGLLASSLGRAEDLAPAPPAEGYFFVGGRYVTDTSGEYMVDQMYVEYRIPAHRTRSTPLVMFSGGGQSGLNYSGTPDNREGWADYFVAQGYTVYILDQPARARSPWQPAMGTLTPPVPTAAVQLMFTAPELYKRWPQAVLHNQWPGKGVAGDPVFDQYFGQVFPGLADFAQQQALNQKAGAALLDRIGPAILLTHSQSGTFGWLVADARPGLVKGIVALEPSGPPVHDFLPKGAPDWFADGPLTKPYGLTAQPLTYAPTLNDGEALSFTREDAAEAPGLVRCWAQAPPARSLVNLASIPVVVIQTEASYHAPYDQCTVNYLRQAGVHVDFVRLADKGIHGNGHMMMLELNNLDIAAVIAGWLDEAVH